MKQIIQKKEKIMKMKIEKSKIETIDEIIGCLLGACLIILFVFFLLWEHKQPEVVDTIPDYSADDQFTVIHTNDGTNGYRDVYRDQYKNEYVVYFNETVSENEFLLSYTIKLKISSFDALRPYTYKTIFEGQSSDYMSSSEIASLIKSMSGKEVGEPYKKTQDQLWIALLCLMAVGFCGSGFAFGVLSIEKCPFIVGIEDDENNVIG